MIRRATPGKGTAARHSATRSRTDADVPRNGIWRDRLRGALIPLAQRFGAKRVGAAALVCSGVGLVVFANLGNRYALLVPEIGVGRASMPEIPYIMLCSALLPVAARALL